MQASFRSETGTNLSVSTLPDPLPADAEPGKLYTLKHHVALVLIDFQGGQSVCARLRKSEARAIASALMGAAAEL